MQIHTGAQPLGGRQASPVAVQRSGQSGLQGDWPRRAQEGPRDPRTL